MLRKLYDAASKAAANAERQLRAELKKELLRLYKKELATSTATTIADKEYLITPLGFKIDDEDGEVTYTNISKYGLHDANYSSIGFHGAPITWMLKVLTLAKKARK